MKKVFRYLLYTFLVIVVIVAGLAAIIAFRGIPKFKADAVNLKVEVTPARVVRGQKLASMLCAECHMDPSTGKLTGRLMNDVPQFGVIYSKNITRDLGAGIGNWSDGQLAYLLRTGLKPDGTFLPLMAKLSHTSDEDVASIIAYLRSEHPWVAPDKKVQPASDYSFLAKFLTNASLIKPSGYPAHPIAEPDTANAVQWGRYIALAQLECYSCHSLDFAKNDYEQPEKSAGFFGGGNKFALPEGGERYSRNITMDEATGIGKWSEDDFVKAVRYNRRPDGQLLRKPMPSYGNLSDAEARAIFAYLKTIPKIHNQVERK
ncbi:c-type cytochrome [Paraflavisolibacter sp. H34]|uniref:c-type cytochrome n=1 Tax=Huijunlia imazamoxiresistens TaxID=3127457 RepID=UPI0030170354